jgi:hypothetical protein
LQEKLLQSGHYEISGDLRVRDWIDTSKLLYKQEYLKKIIRGLIKAVSALEGPLLFIGIDFPGSILSAHLGILTGYPFTYVISNKNKDNFAKQEVNIEVNPQCKIILVTDVIVTGNTLYNVIDDLIKKYNLIPEKISLLLSVFYRNPIGCRVKFYLDDYTEKIHYLNHDFDIEICGKKDCLFKSNNVDLYCNKPK